MPSKTLPSHTSMLTGQPPERHQVLWNTALSAKADLIELPTVFGLARSRGYRTAAFFSKSKFSHLQVPGTLDYSQSPGGWFGRWSSEKTVGDVRSHLEQLRLIRCVRREYSHSRSDEARRSLERLELSGFVRPSRIRRLAGVRVARYWSRAS